MERHLGGVYVKHPALTKGLTTVVQISKQNAQKKQQKVCIATDTPINVYAQFCTPTAKSKFPLVSPDAD